MQKVSLSLIQEKQAKIESPSFFIGNNAPGIISFGSGAPDLDVPDEARAAFSCLSGSSSAMLYGPVQGNLELREELSKRSHDCKGIEPENIIITNGASEALDLALRALPQNSKVLLMKPYYYSYPHLVEMAGHKIELCEMKDDSIDLEKFREKAKGCAAALVNSPCNPTGIVERPETLKEISKICEEENCLLLFDEVYSELVYEGRHFSPKGRHVLGLNSFSKTFSLCGARIGYACSENNALIKKMVEEKAYTSMNTSTISQAIALAAIKTNRKYVEGHRKIFRGRRDLVYNGLIGLGLELRKPDGAFYALPKVGNPQKLMEELFFEKKVIVYNGAWFGAEGRIRMSYALDEEKIGEGLERIGEVLGK